MYSEQKQNWYRDKRLTKKSKKVFFDKQGLNTLKVEAYKKPQSIIGPIKLHADCTYFKNNTLVALNK